MSPSTSPSATLRVGMRGPVRTLAVVFGDQLDRQSPVLMRLDRDRDAVLMMEVAGESTHVPVHRQRTALFLASMRHFALDLVRDGFRVRYVKLDTPDNTHTLDGELRRALAALSPETIALVEPGEWRIVHQIESWRRDLSPPIDIHPDPHFTVSRQAFSAWATDRKQLIMEYFYREQRRRLDILMDGGRPRGGRWNFDPENRRSFRSVPDPPRRYAPRIDAVTDEVIGLVRRRLPQAPGRLERFPWPVTREQARRALDDFIRTRLPRFGTHQDAMWMGEPWLFHSTLSPALNLRLLTVRECVEPAIAELDDGRAPINAVEGFIRQIIGWREFIRGVYWHEGPDYRDRNQLGEHGRLPEFYWSGETDMACLSESIGQVLDLGYGHHIQRLMVTGNFALISGVSPRSINDWYLGMYVDAVDWVTTPNVIGMVMHADGGVVGTKPYAASGRYISRMSNYCVGCRYDPAKRVGEGDGKGRGAACPFTTFYWDFLIRHRKRFADNRRMSMALRNVDRLAAGETKAIRARAGRLRRELGIS